MEVLRNLWADKFLILLIALYIAMTIVGILVGQLVHQTRGDGAVAA